MAGTNNFKVFNESQTNIMDDAAYDASTYRQNGAVAGIAPSNLHNKLYRQTSIMAAAIAQAMANKGYNVSDANFNNLVAVLENIMTSIPDNAVTDAKIGLRSINDTIIAGSGSDILTNLLGKLGNMVKQITGKTTWWTPPATTLEAANTHITAATGAHAASAISSTATGDVAATNVQAAIAELAAEKVAKDTTYGSMRIFKNVAQYVNLAIVTGSIKITIPAITVATFIDMVISGFNHSSGGTEKWELRVAGQLGTNGTVWNSVTATITPNAPFSGVRAMTDGTNTCLVLGATSTAWTYPGITVDEVRVTGAGISQFTSNFPMTLITSETGLTLQATATIKTLATIEGNIAPYGLGTAAAVAVSDWDNYLTTGFFSGINLTHAPAPTDQFFVMVIRYSDSYVIQQAWGFTGDSYGIAYTRGKYLGTWSAWKRLATTDSPTFTGIPKAPTAAIGTNTDQIATMAALQAAVTASAPGSKIAARVNFDGTTSSPTIRGSYNVSSVVKNAVGDYTINFTNPMPNANYTFSYAVSHYSTTAWTGPFVTDPAHITTTSIRIKNMVFGGTLVDEAVIAVDIYV